VLGLYQGDQPLIDILNRCSTAFGYRTFKERLLQPMINVDDINKTYDDVDILLKDNRYLIVRKHLSAIMDLERLKRKMKTNKMAPHDWVSFNESLTSTKDIKLLIDFPDEIISNTEIDSIILQFINIIDLDEAGKYNLTNLQDKSSIINFFKKGIYTDIDLLLDKSQTPIEFPVVKPEALPLLNLYAWKNIPDVVVVAEVTQLLKSLLKLGAEAKTDDIFVIFDVSQSFILLIVVAEVHPLNELLRLVVSSKFNTSVTPVNTK
jgi:hypothetical protein